MLRVLFLLLAFPAYAQEITREVVFEYPASTSCEITSPNQVCRPVLGYRIYIVGGDLLLDTKSLEVSESVSMVIGRQTCFEIEPYNEVNSATRTSINSDGELSCVSPEWSNSPPGTIEYLNVRFILNSE